MFTEFDKPFYAAELPFALAGTYSSLALFDSADRIASNQYFLRRRSRFTVDKTNCFCSNLSGFIDGIVQSMGETENGPLLLAGLVSVTTLRMCIYYGFFQPSYLWHFQENYGQSWKVGHHLYGHNLPNPLKK